MYSRLSVLLCIFAQALTSALVFKMLDTDESGQIDSDELFETVTSIFAGRLNSKVRWRRSAVTTATNTLVSSPV